MEVFWPELLMMAAGLFLYIPTLVADGSLALALRGEVNRMATAGKRSAQTVRRVLENRRRWIVAAILLRVGGLILIGMGLAMMLAHVGTVGSVEPWWLWTLAALAVWILLVVLHLLLRLMVQKNPTSWALRMASWMQVSLLILSPLLWLLSGLTSRLRVGLHDEEDSILLSDDGTRLVLPADGDENDIEESEREMLSSILEMNETVVREVMVPRTAMVTLDVETPLEQAVDVVLRAGHSRIPVYEENVDQILGLLYAKDLLRVYHQQRSDAAIGTLLRPAYFVPLTKKVGQLLAEMQKHRVHIAIVVDEYGGTSGLATIEDIIEEIVGEIQDEYDSAEEALVQGLEQGAWVVSGRLDLYGLGKLMGVDLDDEDSDTVGGLVLGTLGHIPEVGESVDMYGWRFTVLAIEGRRVQSVRIEPIPAADDEEESTAAGSESTQPRATHGSLRMTQSDRSA